MLDTWTPRWVAAAITGLARKSTSAAGSRVTNGASRARKAKSSRTMMKMNERPWVLLRDDVCVFWVSTTMGSSPVRLKLRPPVECAWRIERMLDTTVCSSVPFPYGATEAWMSACSAAPLLERPRSCTEVTLWTRATNASTRVIVG
jgi:hypothetical protein